MQATMIEMVNANEWQDKCPNCGSDKVVATKDEAGEPIGGYCQDRKVCGAVWRTRLVFDIAGTPGSPSSHFDVKPGETCWVPRSLTEPVHGASQNNMMPSLIERLAPGLKKVTAPKRGRPPKQAEETA